MNVSVVYGVDNDSYAFRRYPALTEGQHIHQEVVPDMSGASRPRVHRCEVCGELTQKWEEPLLGLVIRKRKYDISITYDGVLVVSQRFKSIFEAARLSGLQFRALPDDAEFYAAYAPKIVEFDAERRKTRFIKPCQRCGRFESVVGATPVYLKADCAIGVREFVRTDLEFGSHDEKHPLLLCGKDAAECLSGAQLRGLDLADVDHGAG